MDVGKSHDSDCLIEIKSRDHKNLKLDDILVQMWLSGRRRLYLARHVRGRFDTNAVYKGDIDADLEKWRKQHEVSPDYWNKFGERSRNRLLTKGGGG